MTLGQGHTPQRAPATPLTRRIDVDFSSAYVLLKNTTSKLRNAQGLPGRRTILRFYTGCEPDGTNGTPNGLPPGQHDGGSREHCANGAKHLVVYHGRLAALTSAE